MNEVVDLHELSDAALWQLAAAVAAEQHARALAAGDLDAVVADAFSWGFTSRGVAEPRLVGGLVVCPGLLVGRPDHHDCTFVSVDDVWCWEHDQQVADEVARDDRGQRSVTVLVAVEGLVCTQVTSRARRGAHTAKGSRSWQVTGGVLVPAAVARTPRTAERR